MGQGGNYHVLAAFEDPEFHEESQSKQQSSEGGLALGEKRPGNIRGGESVKVIKQESATKKKTRPGQGYVR
jgi:hypothetical protein